MSMKESISLLQKLRPCVYMVLLQFGYAGMYIISTATIKHGMNHYVLVVYRNLIAVAVIAPFALYFDRKKQPKITPLIFLKIVALAMLEPVLDQNFYYVGSKLTDAGFIAAFYNIIPAITFVLAIILRIEKISLRRRRGQAKVIGAAIMLIGAIFIITYKGPIVEFLWSKGRSLRSDSASQEDENMLKGSCVMFAGCVSWSAFFILQSNTLVSFPAELTLTTLICLMGALLGTVVALVMEGGAAKPWVIGFDMRLFTAAYSGVVCSGVAYYVQGVVMKERGPVYVTAFNPLNMIITAFMGSIILAEEITLGRIIGAAIIVIGLYCFIWGKSNEHPPTSPENATMKEAEENPV